MTRVAGLVLAAGDATRFGSPKALALIDGRPMLQHVLDAAADAALEPIIVVLGAAGGDIEAAIRWRGERRVSNPDPGHGLSSSLRIGLESVEALEPRVNAVAILLGDQPRTDPSVVRALLERHATSDRPIVVPRYVEGGGNPVVVDRSAFELVRRAAGDRGLGPLIAEHPELVDTIDVPGRNPDVDTLADLQRLERRA